MSAPAPRSRDPQRRRLILGIVIIILGFVGVLGLLARAAGLQAVYTRPPMRGALPQRGWYWLALSWVILGAFLIAGGFWLAGALAQQAQRISLRQQVLGLAAALLILPALTSFHEFNGLLQGLHESGDASFGIDAAVYPPIRAR